MDKEKIIKAGTIAKEVKIFAKTLVKKDVPLLEIATKIERKIVELGGKNAFPCNTSINEIAAHYTPAHNDTTLARGLIKIDFGVHVDGWTADTAFSVDLENSKENKKLIAASEKALANAIGAAKKGNAISEIGKTIQKTIEEMGARPITNLTGHQMDHYELHAGVSIPNIDDKRVRNLDTGLYAIEPFATNGDGKVHDGKPSGIYQLENDRKPRSPLAREVLDFIVAEYYTLPFCSRWLVNKFGAKALFALRELEHNGNLHHFPQLVEKESAIVAQTENTIFVEDEKTTVTTE